MFNPCCCVKTCKVIDSFNRVDSTDINNGAPLAYSIVSGTWSITSNRLVVSGTNAKLIFPSIGTENFRFRSCRIKLKGDSGSIIRLFSGDYYWEVEVGAPGFCRLYDSSATLIMTRPIREMPGASERQVSWHQGPVSNLGYGVGIYAGTSGYGPLDFCLPLAMSGVDFGIGTGGTAVNVSFEDLEIGENSNIRFGSLPCVGEPNTFCRNSVPENSTGTALSPEWEVDSGTWSRSSNNINCTSAGKILFVGNATYPSLRESLVIASFGGSTPDFALWIDDGLTGVVIGGFGENACEVFVDGVSQATFTLAFGTYSIALSLSSQNGEFYVYVGMTMFPPASATFKRSFAYAMPATVAPAIEDYMTTGTRVFTEPVITVGPGKNMLNACTVSQTETECTPCSTPYVAHDLVFSGISGTCPDLTGIAAAINGVAFRTSATRDGGVHGYVLSCGERLFYSISAQWRPINVTAGIDTACNSTNQDTMFVVTIRLNNAWARFQKTWTSFPNCNVLAGDSLMRTDYESADGFDMSAITCTADAV